MKLSKQMYSNRKATSEIYLMLASQKQPPIIYDDGNRYWVTNGTVAFAYYKKDFIFNHELFKTIDMSAIISGADSTQINVYPDLYKEKNERISVRMASESGEASYIDKKYLDMFSTDCSFKIKQEANATVFVFSPYGECVGIICPIRTPNKW